MPIERHILAAVFGERASLGMTFTEMRLVDFYNEVNRGSPVLASPWSFVGGGGWRRTIYGMVGERICTAKEAADPMLASFMRQYV